MHLYGNNVECYELDLCGSEKGPVSLSCGQCSETRVSVKGCVSQDCLTDY